VDDDFRCFVRRGPRRGPRRAAELYAVAAFLAGRGAAVVVGAAVDGRGEGLVLWSDVEEEEEEEREKRLREKKK
jgi:hypothetical protein